MLGIFGGLILLFFSFYVLYLGTTMGNSWMRFLGLLLALVSGLWIAFSRLKLNVKTLNKYKAALSHLSKNPTDSSLREEAYNSGVHYYKNKRDNRKLLPMDIDFINRDINNAIKKGK